MTQPDRDSGLIDAAFDQVLRHRGSSSQRTTHADSPMRHTFSGYSVVREIHRGGQGVVYEAVQESTRRSVAIKVMHRSRLDDARHKARFDREVQILGQLNHPNIVTIHHSGSSADGDYFIMDHVEGASLDTFAAGLADRSERNLLELFCKICEAVNVAHLHGVIHRDLKPANIRVDRRGEPRILDFGLAKLSEVDPADGAPRAADTATGQFVGSMPWASPEQVAGAAGAVDVRTDVYSLGVVFYHLLTGAFPYRVDGNPRDVIENICNTRPRPPGTVRRGLNDEIDTIALTCLRKERERRYQNAGEIAREIRRYLGGDPIAAKSDSGWYRARKFVRKHRVRAAMIAMVCLFAISSVAGLVFVNQRERRLRLAADTARRKAENQQAVATAVVDFLTRDILRGLDPYDPGGNELSARALFDRAAKKVQSGALDDQPRVEAEIRSTLGLVYQWLDRPDAAVSQLEPALALLRQELGPRHQKTLNVTRRLGSALSRSGRMTEAEAMLREALAGFRQHAGPDDLSTVLTKSALAGCLLDQGRAAEAESVYREVLDARRRLQGPEHSDTLAVMSNLASALLVQGRQSEAAALFETALQAKRQVHGNRHPETLIGAMHLADLRRRLGDLETAEPLAREAFRGLRKRLGWQHISTTSSIIVLTEILQQRGRYDETGELLRQASRAIEQETGSLDSNDIQVLSRLAMLEYRQGRLEAAERLLRQAVSAQRTMGPAGPRLAGLLSHLGKVYCERDALLEAERCLTESREICEREFGARDRRTIIATSNLATARNRQGRPEEAEQMLRRALETRREAGKDDELTLSVTHNLATTLRDEGRLSAAEGLFREALDGRRRLLTNRDPHTVRSMHGLAGTLMEQGRLSEAEPLFHEALENAEAIWPDGHYMTEHFRRGLGECLTRMERYAEAEPLLLQSQEQHATSLPAGHEYRVQGLESLVQLYETWGRPARAARWRAALQTDPGTP